MKKIKEIFRQNKKLILIGLPILLLVLYFVFGRGNKAVEEYVVRRADLTQSVQLSGQVMTSDRADLGFASAGRVAQVSVKNNQKVSEGQTLAQLEIGDLLADLKIKQANLRTSDVDLKAAEDELEKVKKTEDTKVASAYRKLITEDLELVAGSNNYTVETPTISGIYDGPEGQYKINIKRKKVTSSNMNIWTFDLEKTEREINEQGSTPLGTRGLYISFGDEVDSYDDTTWYLDIPNKSGDAYLANYNAYNEAKNDRDLAIKNAEVEYERLLTEDDGGSSVAQAEIQKINAEIRKNTIHAPFAGVVTNIEKEVGENASVGERVITILGEDTLEVVLQVSELDVSRLSPEASIVVSLDAFRDEKFVGTLRTINSRETEIDGVPVYEAFVELQPDPRIKTGMSANGTIVLESKVGVIAVPSYLVEKKGEVNVVQVITPEGDLQEREIVLGFQGTDSMVEVVSGLNEGEKIVAVSK